MARLAELIKTLPSDRVTSLKLCNITAKRTVYTAAVTVPGEISVDDPRRSDVRALLERHLTFALSSTPPEHSFALDVDGLLDPAITFCGYRADGELLGVGALKRLDAEHAEIKSMHTAVAARGRGVGRAMLTTCSGWPATTGTGGCTWRPGP